MSSQNTASDPPSAVVPLVNNTSSEWIDVPLQLGPQFKAIIFSCPLGLDHPLSDWLIARLDEFWVRWPIEDDPLLFEPEFEEEKARRSKEIVSLWVMGLEEHWSNPTLCLEGDAGSVERMFVLMFYLHDLIDDLFLLLHDDTPVGLQNTPGLGEVHWM